MTIIRMLGIVGGAVLCLAALSMIAIVSISASQHAKEERAEEVQCESAGADVIPSDVSMRTGRQFRVNCPSADAGTSIAELLVPVDGGTAGDPVEADSIYVAPIVGSVVKVHVGLGGSVTSSTGFEIGPSARDGNGLATDLTKSAQPVCKSAGAAQQVDVVIGRK